MIIDGDGHFVEPLEVWTNYFDPSLRDNVQIVHAADDNRVTRIMIGSDTLLDEQLLVAGSPKGQTYGPFGIGDSLNPGGFRAGKRSFRGWQQAHPGGWDAQERLAVHDADGISAAVMFPTFGLYLHSFAHPKLAVAASEAINRWAADYASYAPDELKVVATLPAHFPDLAAAELVRCVEESGFVAGMVRPNPTVDGRRLDHPSYDVLWDTAQGLGVPICVHNAAIGNMPQVGWDRYENLLTRSIGCHSIEGIMAFATLYQGHVFERYPKLKFGFMEASCGWVPFWMERIDEKAETIGWMLDPPPKRSATDIFISQCFVGCEGEERMVPYVQALYGERKVLWATDFPHYDTVPPYTKEMAERSDLTPSQFDGVMAGAAIDFYNLDTSAILRANTKRIGGGPTR